MCLDPQLPGGAASAVWFTSFGRGQEWTIVFSNNSNSNSNSSSNSNSNSNSNKQVGFN